MIIFYVFFNLVIGDFCCFKAWTEWQQSLSCGEVCRFRKRDLWPGPAGILGDCHNDHVSCPWVETENDYCEIIDCREYDFKIKLFVRYL